MKKPEDRNTVKHNGVLTMEQFLWMMGTKHESGESWLTHYMRNIMKRDVQRYCPPLDCIYKAKATCSYCNQCYEDSINAIKETKLTYKLGRQKWNKEEILSKSFDDVFPKGFFVAKDVKYKHTK